MPSPVSSATIFNRDAGSLVWEDSIAVFTVLPSFLLSPTESFRAFSRVSVEPPGIT